MKPCNKIIASIAAVAMSMVLFAQTACASSVKNNNESAMAALNQFYSALNDMLKGDVEPMKAVWSHADDVVYMGPFGDMQTGWKAVLANWQGQADMKMGGQVTLKDPRIIMGKTMFTAFDYEIGTNVDENGHPQKVDIRSTNVFRKENGKWRMVGHHTDRFPGWKNN